MLQRHPPFADSLNHAQVGLLILPLIPWLGALSCICWWDLAARVPQDYPPSSELGTSYHSQLACDYSWLWFLDLAALLGLFNFLPFFGLLPPSVYSSRRLPSLAAGLFWLLPCQW